MTLWTYLDRHPWWALMYLLVIALSAIIALEKR